MAFHSLTHNFYQFTRIWRRDMIEEASSQECIWEIFFKIAGDDDQYMCIRIVSRYPFVHEFADIELHILHLVQQVIGKVPWRLIYFIYQYHRAAGLRFYFSKLL